MNAKELKRRLSMIIDELKENSTVFCSKDTDQLDIECMLHDIKMRCEYFGERRFLEGAAVWVSNKSGDCRTPGIVGNVISFSSGRRLVSVMVQIGDDNYPTTVDEKYLEPREEVDDDEC